MTTAAMEDEAEVTVLESVEICESVCAFTLVVCVEATDASEDEAFCTSVSVASDPELKPAPVSVRVPLFQTSAASVPNDESVRPVKFQMVAGSMAKSELEAFPTTRLVLLFTLVVPAEIADASDEVAVTRAESV